METSEPTADGDDRYDDAVESSATPLFSSGRELLLFAVLLPAAVAISNQLLFSAIANRAWPQSLLYPWMAFSTAVLSWCVGRYLNPAWLRWLVFGWCLTLLDILTIAACLSGPIPRDFAYVLVAAQAGLLVVWSVSAKVSWQIRLPTAMLAAAFLIAFAGIWRDDEWSVLVTVTVANCLPGERHTSLERFHTPADKMSRERKIRIKLTSARFNSAFDTC